LITEGSDNNKFFITGTFTSCR